MDGTVVGLNLHAVCAILEFYGEDEKMLDNMLFCWRVEQETQNGNEIS